MSFGGQSWPINPLDFNAGQISGGSNPLCEGAIFDLTAGSDNIPGSSNPDWVVGDTFLVRKYLAGCTCVLHKSSCSFPRKMCTRCSVPHQRLLGLPSCLLWLVEQVREFSGRILGLIYTHVYSVGTSPGATPTQSSSMCNPFSVGRCGFSYLPSIRCYVNHNPCIPDVFDCIHCCYHVMSLRKVLLWMDLLPKKKNIIIGQTVHHFSELLYSLAFPGFILNAE